MLKDNYTDEQLGFEARRALLSDDPVPDAGEAFAEFCERNGLAAPGVGSSAVVSHRHRSFRLLLTGAMAAAAVVLSFVFILPRLRSKNNEDALARLQATTVRVPARQQQVKGSRVYASVAAPGSVSLSFSGQGGATSSANGMGFTVASDKTIHIEKSDDNTAATLTVPQGHVAQIVLTDGTRVWLNADSRLYFPRSFSRDEPRRVRLEGEAYFEVHHDSHWPFIVDGGSLETKVLGTQFSVRAYAGEKPCVMLVSGRVQVGASSPKVRPCLLSPGEQTILGAQGLQTSAADLETGLAWKDGRFYFEGATLRDILVEIGRWYNYDVVFTGHGAYPDRLHFSGLRSMNITDIVDQLNMISRAHITLKRQTIEVE